ncbi:MAG: ABC transporter ATP-binding protein [Dehalococcoidia bacterium]
MNSNADSPEQTELTADDFRHRHNGRGGDPNHHAPIALQCAGLTKTFLGDVQAVHQFDLTVRQGQIVALLGPSGCGKTTALRLIAGFEQPDRGTIHIGDQSVFGPGSSVPPEKRMVGMVFQEGALFPHLSVEQNISYGLTRNQARKGRVDEVLRLVGLYELRHRMPHELSGGQQQRVALARALAPKPEVLLLDEPFSNLDPGLRDQVRRDVVEILRASNSTAIFVTHDQEEALLIGDRIAVMHRGRVEQVDSPEDIFHHPATRFVAEFIGMVDFLDARREGANLVTDVGITDWPVLCPPESELEVMVRPDCLDCYPSEQDQGVISGREFRGGYYLYRVSLPSGNTVRCLLSHAEEYDVGTPVTISIRNGHGLRPFLDGKAVTP